MDIFDLVAKLTLDSSEYEQGLNDAEQSADGFGSRLGGAAKGAMAVGAAGAAAVTAIGGMIAKETGNVAAYGDDIEKTAQKMGFSFEAYQEWDQIMQHNGSSIKSVRTAMQTLSKQATKNAEDFEQLGISQEELANMGQQELFERVISGLQDMGEGTERTALATKLLGRGSKELGPLLNMTSEQTEEMRQKVHDLGGVMSDDAVKASAAYQDSLQDMQLAIDSTKRGIVTNFLPSVTDVMNGIAELFSGDSDKGIGMIKDGLDKFISKLTETIPKVIETGSKILLSLVQAITENLPEIFSAGVTAIVELAKGIGQALPDLIPAAIDAVLTIVEGLIDNIDEIIDAGVTLIIGLAEGLINAIPRIIEKIPVIIEKLVTALISAAPKIAEAGVKLLVSLVKNLPQIIASIVKAIPKIISAIVKGFANGISSMVKVGKDLLAGLGKGLVDGVKGVVEKAKSVAGNVLSAVKGFFGVSSPSKVFHGIGGFLMEGLANGITDGMGMVENAMDDLDSIIDAEAPTSEIATDSSTTTTSYGDDSGYFAVPRQEETRQLTVILELDRMTLGRAVYNLNNEETQRVGVRLAGGYA